MLKSVLLSTAALALLATAANAGSQMTMSADHRFVSIEPGKASLNVPSTLINTPSHKWKFSSFNKDKNGVYFCCFGNTLTGPSNTIGLTGKAYGVAEQFKLSKAASITTLAAAVGFVEGYGNGSTTLTLYADNGSNSPGTELANATATATQEFGTCCGIIEAKISSTSLSANTPYWVAITTTGSNYEAAPFQVWNEVNSNLYVSSTSNGGTSWSAGAQLDVEQPAIGVK
jgi:hypothetical protein